jgi:hypothetical protein
MHKDACPKINGYTNSKEIQMKSTFAKTAAALAVLALCSGAAQASTITVNSDLGTLSQGFNFFPNTVIAANTPFSFGFSFTTANPYTSIASSINWLPQIAIPNFAGVLYSVSGCASNVCTVGSQLASFSQNGDNNWNLPANGNFETTPGQYAYMFTGTTGNQSYGFSGQTTADVPAPAVLGLVGLGLIGMGFGRKARRA